MMRPRAGNGPSNMTVKLLGCCDEAQGVGGRVSVGIDQVAIVLTPNSDYGETLCPIERAKGLDLAVAYDPYCIRDSTSRRRDDPWPTLKRLGILRGRCGIGFPGAVHLERCAAPTRILVTDSPDLALLGGLGMLVLHRPKEALVDVIATGRIDWRVPQVVQIILSGRLNAAVTARDVALELIRRGSAERIASIASASNGEVLLEFSGPGTRSLSVPERALLCATASELGAVAAISACDEKTELFLRDQRRSKAYRQLAPDAGAPCADVISLDLSTVVPLISLESAAVLPVTEAANHAVKEVFIGGETSATLRDLLSAAAWFKTRRIAADVDVMVVPATRQVLEAIVAHGILAQLLSSGARLLAPDERLLCGGQQVPPTEGLALRSAPFHPIGAGAMRPNIASIDTLCASAIAGTVTDPRGIRKAQRVVCPRELPIDDSLLFDKRPNSPATIPPPREPPRNWGSEPENCPPTSDCSFDKAPHRQRAAECSLNGPS